jgi:hypothetical protein
MDLEKVVILSLYHTDDTLRLGDTTREHPEIWVMITPIIITNRESEMVLKLVRSLLPQFEFTLQKLGFVQLSFTRPKEADWLAWHRV